jgi:outer membrane protein OmpA-like peptidoglycan-associated protein
VRWAWCLALAAAFALGQQRNFVSCPIVRDTQTVPCFLAEYDGELYYLGIQQDITSEFHPPQLKHEVLVEGRIAEGPRVCGGIPLQPVSISVVKEVNLACNTLLPAEPGIEAPPAPRGPGPSSRRPEAGGAPREALTGRQEFVVLYSFNDDYLEYGANRVVTEAATYAKRIGASNVKVAGYRATTVLSAGDRLVEKAGLAEKRAQNIATLLRGLGVSGVTVEWKNEPEPGDGRTDPSRRRVTILVTPTD